MGSSIYSGMRTVNGTRFGLVDAQIFPKGELYMRMAGYRSVMRNLLCNWFFVCTMPHVVLLRAQKKAS